MVAKKSNAKATMKAVKGKLKMRTAKTSMKPAKKERQRDLAGLKAAKKATTMSKEEFQKHRKATHGQWPQPKYMTEDHPDGKGQACYRDQTFEVVTRFTSGTKLSYRPHAKAPGSKSHVRYEEYSKAKTVGEALKRGSWPGDWCWDIERGFIKVLGPLRKEPLDITEIQSDSTLTDVDRAVVQWYKKELAKKYNLDYKELVSVKGAGESLLMRAHRLVAVREAKTILADCAKKKRMVADEELQRVLKLWGFARNVTRLNVMPEGAKFVWSDTLGLLRDRCGDIHLTKSSYVYPEFVEVMSKWLTDRLPASEAKNFKWTTFNVNKDYAGAIHRDGNNFGPSMISAFGDFTGGHLKYYVHDNCKIDLAQLEKTSAKAAKLDLKENLVLFSGNTAHAVDKFEGSRFSIVFFTLGCHSKMKQDDREKLNRMGLAVPKPDENPYGIICPPLGERSDRRYKDIASPQKASLPAYRAWSKTKLSQKKLKR